MKNFERSGPYFLPFCCGEFLKVQPLFYYFWWLCMSTYSQNKWLEMILNFRSQSQKMWATITHDHDCQRPLPNEPQSLTFMIWLAMIADHIHSSVSLVPTDTKKWPLLLQVHKTITKREESSFLDVVYAGSMVELICGLAQNTMFWFSKKKICFSRAFH